MAAEKPVEVEFGFETECVNHLAQCRYDLKVPMKVSAKMMHRGVTLVDVYYVMSCGRVVRSGMRDRASLWVVRGKLVDGGQMDVTMTFRFSDLHVELIDIA